MRLARTPEPYSDTFTARGESLTAAIGEKRHKLHATYKELFEEAKKVDVPRLADERKKRDDEIKLHREMALQLIDLGYRAMATRLHPDRGGSAGRNDASERGPRSTEIRRRNKEVCLMNTAIW